ncbi:MAG TPA: hypothetical protein VIH46_09850 [Candidatus Acidoferrales bacterium]
MKTPTRFLLLLANGFVCYYFWNEHKLGMSVARTVVLLFVSLIAVNLALYLGQRLGDRRAQQLAARRNERR